MKNKLAEGFGFLLTIIVVLVLSCSFGIWCGQNRSVSIAGWLAAFSSVILFTVLVIRCIPEWSYFINKRDTDFERICISRKIDGQIMVLFALSLFLHLCIATVARIISGKSGNVFEALQVYNGIDSKYYLNIAREGYRIPDENGEFLHLVFFPGYPLLVRAFMMIFHNEMVSGYLASWIPFIFSGPVLYRLFRLDYDHEKSVRILWLLCLMPAAVFYSYPMSESLFLLLSALCLYCARTRRWPAAGIFGMMTAFTRSVGLLILAPLFFEGLRQWMDIPDRRQRIRFFVYCGVCLFIVPIGTLLYLWINHSVTGDPLIFMQYQNSHWHQQLSWFFSTAATQAGYAVSYFSEMPEVFWGLSVPNLFVGFFSVLLILFCRNRLRASYTLWFIVYFMICYGTSWLLSGPRYMSVFFPLAIAVEELSGKKKIIPLICMVLTVLYTICFALRWGVW